MQFQHKYKLVVGKPPIVRFPKGYSVFSEKGVFGTQDIPVPEDTRTVTLDALEFTEVHIEASIDSKSDGGGKTSCVIKIYNLSRNSLAIVERLNNYVILYAGWQTDKDLPMVFTGQVANFETVRSGVDTITTLLCQDGYIQNNTIRVSKTYPRNYSAAQVIDDLIDTYRQGGVPLGNFVRGASSADRDNYVQLRTPDEIVYSNGYSAMGYLSDVLTDVCKSVGYVNYIAGGKLYVQPSGYTKQVEVFEYKEDMLYSLQKSGKLTTTPAGKDEIGLSIKMQLDGRLDVDKYIKILDGDYKGVYRILTVKHTLNYEDSPWDTDITCKKLNTPS